MVGRTDISEAMGSDSASRLVLYAPVVAAAVVLLWHTLQYSFITDDAYISFVYARNLAEHGQLSFNLGHPVEGYTNFLWTFVLGVLMVVGLPPELTSLWLGTGFAIGTLVAVTWLSYTLVPSRNPLGALASALLAFTAGYACWASGGLETQMFTFFVVAALCALVRAEAQPKSLRWVGIALALAAMTRPEGLLIAGCVTVHRLVCMGLIDHRWRPSRGEWTAAAFFIGLWGPWFLWRWWYYGHVFPNTYYVKAAGAASASYVETMRANGLHYLWTWARDSHAIYAAPLALVGALVHVIETRAGELLVRVRPSTGAFRFGSLALLIIAAYLLYVASVGGDFMGLHRFVMPVTVLVTVLACFGLVTLARLAPVRQTWIALVLGALVLVGHAHAQLELTARSTDSKNLKSDKGIDTPAYLALYAADRAVIGRHMRDCFEPGDFSIFGGVGAKPYYADTEGIDVFGLVSERIAHEVPRTRPRAGHNKWGPDKLLLEYDPTFVFSCYSIHRDPARPQWNCRPSSCRANSPDDGVCFWIKRGYEPVTLHIPGLRERGEYYTFLAKKARAFRCQGQVD